MSIHSIINKVIPSHYTIPSLLVWVFITAVNLCVAIPISIRLCIAQKKTHDVLSRSPLKSVAIILIECGTLLALCSIVMMILHVRAYSYAIASVGIATNIAVRLVPSPCCFVVTAACRLCLSCSSPRDMQC